MAIPTGYTLESFSAWLTEEVFFEDTEGLGLDDLSGGNTDVYKDLTLSGNTTFVPVVNSTYNLNILPSPFVFEQNEQITLENGIVLEVYSTTDRDWNPDNIAEDSVVIYGDTVLPARVISVPTDTDIHDGLRLRLKTADASDRVPNPVINTIMGQALAQMNLTDISQINSTNMYLFRQHAVVEAFKTIMQNNASFYTIFEVETGATVYGGTLTNQLRAVFEFEGRNLFNYIQMTGNSHLTRGAVLEEGLSANSGVKVVW